jgi:DivIVA domain-containing protein
MPLSPDEVVNKRFSATKFRQGYDEEEVDEFLDEVVAELRRLTGENEELKAKLAACERRVGELSRGGGAATGPVPVPTPEPEVKAPEPEPEPEPAAPPAPAPMPAPAPVVAPAAAAAGMAGGAEGAAGMLALAQKLHDEHIEAGKNEGAKLVSEAQAHADRLVREAEDKQRRTLGTLEQERAVLERKVEELRSFERDYRRRLKAYLEGQLRDLDSMPVGGTGSGGGESRPAAQAGGAPPLPTRVSGQGAHQQAEGAPAAGQDEEPPRFPFGN